MLSRRTLGYGYVNYGNPQDAARSLEHLNFTPLNGKPIRIMYSNRDPSLRKSGAGNIFIKPGILLATQKVMALCNLTMRSLLKKLLGSRMDEDLKNIFSDFGTITSAVVMRGSDGKSRGFGFVNLENTDAAARTVESLNGNKFDDKEWYVGKTQKKSEREAELKLLFQQMMKEAVNKFQVSNLYIKNLDDSITEEKLKDLFTPYGIITSCKVMRDPSGISKGSGFVAFSTPEEASRALAEMNGKMVISKHLYVALAQRKEERRARLQAQFLKCNRLQWDLQLHHANVLAWWSRSRTANILWSRASNYFSTTAACPGNEAWWAPMPNFYLPMVQQGQRPNGRRGGIFPQNQKPIPLMQQQMLPRGRVYRYLQGRGLPDGSIPNVAGGMFSVPYDMGGIPMRDASHSQQIPIGARASALTNATPEHQRTVCTALFYLFITSMLHAGENLYPLVEQVEPEAAAKVTGMLLETEVLHLLESPEALKTKVAEAMEVLRNVAQHQQGGGVACQLSSLS
ncbi:putative E3 ubiquitin ligase SUD1-like isoform X1 [Hibiscus syriacus]|uniref:E3 ubiquitin ligase SUD1-like isoform X1 n=1 Tax=Hibiscus syriacus TaxID=106335 RepID=A0A6A2X019_HIBSY|nr:putative E3 ubiquitin ligase SUD1-like isoform X1 [Hibiscus syriacus]